MDISWTPRETIQKIEQLAIAICVYLSFYPVASGCPASAFVQLGLMLGSGAGSPDAWAISTDYSTI